MVYKMFMTAMTTYIVGLVFKHDIYTSMELYTITRHANNILRYFFAIQCEFSISVLSIMPISVESKNQDQNQLQDNLALLRWKLTDHTFHRHRWL